MVVRGASLRGVWGSPYLGEGGGFLGGGGLEVILPLRLGPVMKRNILDNKQVE